MAHPPLGTFGPASTPAPTVDHAVMHLPAPTSRTNAGSSIQPISVRMLRLHYTELANGHSPQSPIALPPSYDPVRLFMRVGSHIRPSLVLIKWVSTLPPSVSTS